MTTENTASTDRASTEENLRAAVRFHVGRNDRIRKRAERAETEAAELRAPAHRRPREGVTG